MGWTKKQLLNNGEEETDDSLGNEGEVITYSRALWETEWLDRHDIIL